MKLLTIGNPKTAKGLGLGYLTAVLHLAPSMLSGIVNVCSRATAGCIAACLNTAGRGGIIRAGETTNAIQLCRIRRTELLVSHPLIFAGMLSADIAELQRAAARHGMRPALRLNGTSDLYWGWLANDLGKAWDAANVRPSRASAVIRDIVASACDAMPVYDYTKRPGLRADYDAAGLPVHLTFSRAETAANKRDAKAALANGQNVAVVFSTKRNVPLPATFGGFPVIDGDAHDLRFLDPAGVVVGLRAKGRARKDATGFVVRV